MPTVVIFALPLYGHMPPVLQLSGELGARGLNVICYGAGSFKNAIKETGATYRDYPSPLLENLSYTPDFCWRVMSCAQSILQRELPALRADQPVAIIYDAMLPWGPALRGLLAVPTASLIANFAFPPAVRETLQHSRIPPRNIADLMAGYHARAEAGKITLELQAEFGVTVEDAGGTPFPDDRLNLVFNSRLLQPFAGTLDDRYAFVGPALPPCASPADPVLEGLTGRPLVFISFGTVFNADHALFESCFDALQGVECEAIASTGRAYTPDDFPQARHVRILPFVRQSAVLQHAGVVINNGGMNTVCESLSHRVPVLIIPATEEQEILARRIEELGCGIHISREDATADVLAAAVNRLLNEPGYRARCSQVAESFREAGGSALAVRRIESLIAARCSENTVRVPNTA
jgi:MGT family glycosyltransferase